ncbi:MULTISPECIES: transposase, partial [Pirellulaceae]
AMPGRSSRRKQARSKRYRSRADAAKAMTVQLLATVCWHIGSGMPACWKLASSHGSERQSAIDLLDQLPSKARLVADAEYVGRPLWSAIIESKRSFVIRVGSNIRLLRKLDPSLKRDTEWVYHWPHKSQLKGEPPLLLRLVAVITERGWIYLLTNEWNLTNQQIAELYQARWGIEVFFRTVKQDCGKARLQCRTPENARTELSWTLLAIWASLFVAKRSLHEAKVPLNKLSPTRVIDLLQAAMRDL